MSDGHVHCWQTKHPNFGEHATCFECCECDAGNVTSAKAPVEEVLDCQRCDAVLDGDPTVHRVEMRVGASFRWFEWLCQPCRLRLIGYIKKGLEEDRKTPDKDGPRQITI